MFLNKIYLNFEGLQLGKAQLYIKDALTKYSFQKSKRSGVWVSLSTRSFLKDIYYSIILIHELI